LSLSLEFQPIAMHQKFLQLTINLAIENIHSGGGPFAAIIVKDGELIARGCNRVTDDNDPTAHAEINAIRNASKHLNNFNLSGCIIYSSCEPCPMCLSAIYWAHLDAVYFGATHRDAAEAGFDDSYIYHELRAKPGDRHLLLKQISGGLEKSPFETWLLKADKVKY